MSAHIITVNHSQVVFGLDWVPLLGDAAEKDEVRRYVRNLNAAYQIRYAGEQAILYGFLAQSDLPERPNSSRTKYISASILLAKRLAKSPPISSNAIWIEVDGQSAKMAILKDGFPLPSGDFFGTIQEAEERLRQIEADSHISFARYGNYNYNYNNSKSEDVQPISLEKLVRDSASEAMLVRASKGVNWPLLALSAMIVAGLTYPFGFGLDYFHPLKKLPKKQREHPTSAYLKALPMKLAAAGVPVSAAMAVILGDWRTEILQGGWFLSKVSCTMAACIYHWSINGGDNLSLRQAVGHQQYQSFQSFQSFDFALDGRTATYSLPNTQVASVMLNAANFPHYKDFKAITGSFAQDLSLLGVHVRFNPPVLFGLDTHRRATVHQTALPSAVTIKSGAMMIDGPAALLQEMLQRLPDTVTIESMDLTIDGLDPKFQLKGTYYVKD